MSPPIARSELTSAGGTERSPHSAAPKLSKFKYVDIRCHAFFHTIIIIESLIKEKIL